MALVIDQAYAEFADDAEYAEGVQLVREGRRSVIALKTLSKAYGLAGLRLGFAITDSDARDQLDRVEEPFFLSRLATAAGPATLADKEWLQVALAAVRRGRDHLSQSLGVLVCTVVPSQANFVFADMGCSARELFRRLMARGVIIRPCDGSGYPTSIRVTVGLPERNERFLTVLAEELRALRAS